jgi:molecular chaperone GrpE
VDAHSHEEHTHPTSEESDQSAAEQQAPAAGEEEEPERSVSMSVTEYEELKTLATERDEYLERLRRAVADKMNLQKRMQGLRESARRDALRDLARNVVPLADALARALQAAEQTEGAESIVEGVRMIEKQFYTILAGLDIHPIAAEGRPFDPNYHDAVLQQPSADALPNTVLHELKKGFVLGEELLRPAQVIVSSSPPQPEQEGEPQEE